MTSSRYAGEFSMQFPGFPQAMTGTIEIIRAAPSKQRVIVELGALGTVDQGTDGKVAWSLQPGGGVQMLEGEDLEREIRDADFYARLMPRERFASAENRGVVEVEGEDCYELVLTEKDGESSTEYFSVETGYRIKSVTGSQFVVYSDYKAFDGVIVPCSLQINVMQGEQTLQQNLTLSTIEIDPEFAGDAFDAPGTF